MTEFASVRPQVGAARLSPTGAWPGSLLAATERIVGPTDSDPGRFSIDWDEPVEEARRLVQEAIDSLDPANAILIFTDMFGGTPTNACLPFLETGRVEILAGVNLPMLVKLTNLQGNAGEPCRNHRSGAGARAEQPLSWPARSCPRRDEL